MLFIPIGGEFSTLLSGMWPMRQIVFWTATHVFHIAATASSTSSDGAINWVEMYCLLAIAALATVIWSLWDSQRENYVTLHKWFRLVVRFTLATVMFIYGMDKVIPTQMPFPNLLTLLTPFGDLSRFGVLWASVGAAPAYEIFAGCAEMLSGILLVVPGTTTLGALICLADMTNVFMLNMTYDVPVKLDSFHWLLLSVVLLAPELPRLTNFFFLDRPLDLPPSHSSSARAAPTASRLRLRSFWACILQVQAAIGFGPDGPRTAAARPSRCSMASGMWNNSRWTGKSVRRF
ncbi:MAG TPA: hypothetical protein VGR72_01425 [Candidatus Acidoferrales bacterium]|nr:hypothetical protein [Candidatus Acidoferrales bacterium]